MKNHSIKDLLLSTKTMSKVTINGWVRTFRANRFIALNDGSSISSVQCVVDFENTKEESCETPGDHHDRLAVRAARSSTAAM